MKLKDLERAVRLTVTGQAEPTLAAVGGGETQNVALDPEFADAIRSLSSRAENPGTKPDDPTRWG
jgi:hypothetical protein